MSIKRLHYHLKQKENTANINMANRLFTYYSMDVESNFLINVKSFLNHTNGYSDLIICTETTIPDSILNELSKYISLTIIEPSVKTSGIRYFLKRKLAPIKFDPLLLNALTFINDFILIFDPNIRVFKDLPESSVNQFFLNSQNQISAQLFKIRLTKDISKNFENFFLKKVSLSSDRFEIDFTYFIANSNVVPNKKLYRDQIVVSLSFNQPNLPNNLVAIDSRILTKNENFSQLKNLNLKELDLTPKSLEDSTQIIYPNKIQFKIDTSSHLKRSCVMLHIYYTEVWPDICQYLKNLDNFDLYVNIVNEKYTDELKQDILKNFPSAHIITSVNLGRDWGGHYQLSKIINFEQYDVVFLCQGKRSYRNGVPIGDDWRKDLFDAIMGSPAQAKNSIKLIREGAVGIVSSKKWLLTSKNDPEAGNTTPLINLSKRFNVSIDHNSLNFSAGSIFAIHSAILKEIFLKLNDSDFDFKDALDGTISHALERFSFILTTSSGLSNAYVNSINIKKIKSNNSIVKVSNPNSINFDREKPIQIIHPAHVSNHANRLWEILKDLGLSAKCVLRKPNSFLNPLDQSLHIILCANVFNRFPHNYIAYQLEQANSSWFTQDYLDKLNNSIEIWDYSKYNIESFKNSFNKPHIFMQLSSLTVPDIDLCRDRDIDVLFYGEVNSRRESFLNEIKKHVNLKIITNSNPIFGSSISSILKRTKIVLNHHFYENGQLEIFRAYESLSNGCKFISEISVDDTFHDLPILKYSTVEEAISLIKDSLLDQSNLEFKRDSTNDIKEAMLRLGYLL